MLNILIFNIPMGCASNSTEIKNSQPEKENKQLFEKNQKEIETSPEEKKENNQQVENILKEEKSHLYLVLIYIPWKSKTLFKKCMKKVKEKKIKINFYFISKL